MVKDAGIPPLRVGGRIWRRFKIVIPNGMAKCMVLGFQGGKFGEASIKRPKNILTGTFDDAIITGVLTDRRLASYRALGAN